MTTDTDLAHLAAGQHGVFTYAEAVSLGMSDRTLSCRVAAGRYVRLLPGVYAIAGSTDTLRRRLVTAVKSLPQLGAVSHRVAAELWGLTNRGISRIEVVTTRWDRSHRHDFIVHESLDLAPADIAMIDGIPVTSAVRTIVDLGAVSRWAVEEALEQGIRLRLYTLTEVEAFVKRVGRRGRRGVGVIRPLIEARRRWDTPTDSALEDRFRKLLASAGLPDPLPQHSVRDPHGRFICRSDFAYPAANVLIELDGEAYHMDRLTFRRDRAKQNAAALLGWSILRYTWWDVVQAPERVVTEVRSALEAGGHRKGVTHPNMSG